MSARPRNTRSGRPKPSWLRSFRRWFDSGERVNQPDADRVEWLRIAPFFLVHAGCLIVLGAGVSAFAVGTCVALYLARMFAITGFYHRYFSHRAFKTSRPVQFAFGLLGNTAAQRGPLWWAAHHRKHHKHADTPRDRHSRALRGFWWSHAGWWATEAAYGTDERQVRDFARYPELRWLDRFDVVGPVLLAVVLFVGGNLLAVHAPGLGTNGWQLLGWGFFVSTALLYHATFAINSVAHDVGSRRYPTADRSRNNWWLAILTLGEGWHNNHHHYPVAARQGFFWWELDPTYYLLRVLERVGLVWDLRPVPAEVREPVRDHDLAREVA